MGCEKIETITAKKLYDMKLPPIRFVVEGLLPQGLHVFAGPPKIGKSWLLMQLAHIYNKLSELREQESR